MRLWPNPGRKRMFGVFRAHDTCLVPTNVVLPRWGSYQGSPNLSAKFEGPL